MFKFLSVINNGLNPWPKKKGNNLILMVNWKEATSFNGRRIIIWNNGNNKKLNELKNWKEGIMNKIRLIPLKKLANL